MWDVEQRRVKINPSSLAQWLYHAIQEPRVRLRIRLRGNNLHVLCEGSQVPSVKRILPRLVKALKINQRDFQRFFRNAEDPIYKIILYGRRIGQQCPNWIEPIVLERLYLEAQQEPNPILDTPSPQEFSPSDEEEGVISTNQDGQEDSVYEQEEPGLTSNPEPAVLISNESLAKTGSPEAIARYLSESLSHLGVSVKVLIQKLPDAAPNEQKRLWAICTCHYSPDASLIAEPIAQQLRDLQLEGFKEAIIRAQVRGETAPDWILQVDLTRTQDMLRDWARWGDIPAIDRLLNECLTGQGLQVGTVRKENTLHIFCAWQVEQELPPTEVPSQEKTIAALRDILENLAPQGLTGATLYGVKSPELQGFIPDQTSTLALDHLQEAPVWVSWLELPAAKDPYLATPTHELASQKNPGALTFLIQRLLNPSIDNRLATGGIRVKLCFKGRLLHLMTEAVICPSQTEVAAAVESLLNRLEIEGITGMRIYGRRAGQTSPLWSYGIDFQVDSTPEESAPVFQRSKTDLNAILPGEEETSLTPMTINYESRFTWQKFRRGVQEVLCGTNIFVREGEEEIPTQKSHWPVALVWGVVGCVLAVQLDWLGGRMVTQGQETGEDAIAVQETSTTGFDGEQFTETDEADKKIIQAAILAAARSQNPSFNNNLLDEKLALYQERVKLSGPPDILIVGSSRALRGVDPTVLREAIKTHKSLSEEEAAQIEIFNFGINGATAQTVDFLLRRLLTPDQLPKLVIWADGARAFNSGRPDLTYEAMASSRGYRQVERGRFPKGQETQNEQGMDLSLGGISEGLNESYQSANTWLSDGLGEFSTLYSNRDEVKTWLTSKLAPPLPTVGDVNLDSLDMENVDTQDIDYDGFLPLGIRFDPKTYYESHPKVTGDHDSDYDSFALYGEQEKAFQAVMEYLNEEDVRVVFVNLPLTDDYLDPVRDRYEKQFQAYMKEAEEEYGIIFRNLAKRWQDDYRYFSDPSHLNRYGARKVSNHLAKDPVISWQLGLENW